MEHKFIKVGDVFINLCQVSSITDSPATKSLTIYYSGGGDGDSGDYSELVDEDRQHFLAALDKIGYYAA